MNGACQFNKGPDEKRKKRKEKIEKWITKILQEYRQISWINNLKLCTLDETIVCRSGVQNLVIDIPYSINQLS